MKIVNYIKESYVEFKDNVTWPTFSKLQQETIIVAIATVLLAIFLYVIDSSFAKVLDVIYSAF